MVGLNLGFGSSSSKSTSTIDKKTMPIAPDWAASAISDLIGRGREMYAANQEGRVAPLSDLTNQAAAGAAGLNTSSGAFDQAMNLASSALARGPASYSAESLLTDLDKYRNPWTQNVVDASLAGFDDQAGQQRAGLSLGLAGRRAGSGADIATALTEGQLGLARGQLESGLRSDAENAAMGWSSQDADRRQSAGRDNAASQSAFTSQALGAATQFADLIRANSGFQADVGTLLQDHDQKVLDAPFDQLDWLAQLQAASGMESLFGEHTTGTEKTKGKSTKVGAGLSF